MVMRQAAVQQSFAQALVRVFKLHVLAHHGDAHFAGGVVHAVDQIEPRLHVRRPRLQPQQSQDLRVQAFFAQLRGHRVNRVHIFH